MYNPTQWLWNMSCSKCQFLIGNVQHVGAYNSKDNSLKFKCQFLIGNVQQQYLSTVFFILLPIFLKINHFLPKKYVDLFYIRAATIRMFTGFADIFLISENRFLRSTYFLSHFCLLFLLNKTPFFSSTCLQTLILAG
mgnify:CR=1 FL=1